MIKLLLSTMHKITTHKIILLVVLHGCKSLPLTLREEHKLQMFENVMLPKILVPNRNEMNNLGYHIPVNFVIHTYHLV
jgi:hypothetical protein